MEDKVRINIQIGDVKHPLVISRDDEPIARRGARLLTERYEHYATVYRSAGLPKDYLMAMAGLDIAMRYLRQDADSNARNAESELEAIADHLRGYLGLAEPADVKATPDEA